MQLFLSNTHVKTVIPLHVATSVGNFTGSEVATLKSRDQRDKMSPGNPRLYDLLNTDKEYIPNTLVEVKEL